MRKIVKDINVFDLKEMYTEKGTYDVRVVFNPKITEHSESASVSIKDSDGNDIKSVIKPWGMKVCCKFTIDDSVADGVATIFVEIPNFKNEIIKDYFKFWIIK